MSREILMQFEGRYEFFGSIFWNFDSKSLVSFDNKTTILLKELLDTGVDNLSHQFKKKNSVFLKRCKELSLIKNNKINYSFVKNRANKSKVLSAPLRIHYAITSKCNLNCEHCFTRNILNRNQKELSFKEKISILDKMQELGVREMLVSGGEPFLAPHFIDFLKEAGKRNIHLKLFSNGFSITENIVKKIKDLPLGYLAISVDGATKYSFKIRGTNCFDLLKSKIKMLSEQCSFPIAMQITLSKVNYDEIEEYLNLAAETGVQRIKIRALKPGGEILRHPEIMLTMQEYLDCCKKAEKLFREKYYSKNISKKKISLDCTLGNLRLVYDENEDNLKIRNTPQPYEGFGCVGGRITFFIDSFGNCHPCAFIDNFLDKEKAFNLKDKTLKEIWDSDPNVCSMRNLSGNPKCLSCSLYNVCRGGCRARTVYYNENKDLNGSDGWCPVEAGLEIKIDSF